MKNSYLLFFAFFTIISFGQKNIKTIGFIENKGQIVDQKGKPNPSVHYLLNTNGLNVQLRNNGFSYDVYEVRKIPLRRKDKTLLHSDFGKDAKMQDSTIAYKYHRIDIDFLNSNADVQLLAEEKSSDYDNYYTVPSAPQGITDVHKYKKVTYQNIYNNIDVVFFIPKDETKAVEYNFVVRPGGKASDIQLQFKGAKTELEANKIKMDVRFGQMEETLPTSWEENGSNKKELAIGYKEIKKNVYGFDGELNTSDKTIVIDPTPVRLWGTYYGGNEGNYATDICSDNNNNVYFSGYTSSTQNIATIGSIPASTYYSYYGYGYIVKFGTNGVRIWGTYYSAIPRTIKVDFNENLYFTGSISADVSQTGLSTPGSHQPLPMGYHYNAFLVKLAPSGIREWGTYYGGTLNSYTTDQGLDISFDNQNNAYLVGSAESLGNIATIGSHQPIHGAGYLDYDGFIAKFTPQGVRVWGTYLGGSGHDAITSSNISNDGFLYVTGNTGSTDNITTPGCYQPNIIGYASGMIAKFTLDGQRVWGSYFGDRTNVNISRVKDNFLYFVGTMRDNNGLNSINTFNPTFQHLPMYYELSSFIVKFDLNTQSPVWGTYFGEFIQDLEINSNNKIFIAGCTRQPMGIATPGAYATINQYSDSYVIRLNDNGQREWGTYYGGNDDESSNGAADVCNKMSLDLSNNIYLVGNTRSTSGLSTPGAHQENAVLNSLGGLYNVFLAKFRDCQSISEISSNSPICIGQNLQLNASGGTGYAWTGPNGFTSTDQNPIILNANASHSGQYTCIISGTGGCDGPASVAVFVGDTATPIANIQNLPTVNGDCNTVVSIIPTALDNCAGTITATTTDPLSYSVPGNYTIHWNYNDGNGNTSSQNQDVVVTATALPSINSPQNFCIQQNATLNTLIITGQNIKWYDALTNGNTLVNSTVLQNGMTYYASQTVNGCESLRVPVTVTIQNTPAPIGSSQSLCATQNPTLTDIIITGTGIHWYSSAADITVLSSTTALVNGTTYYATQTVNGCESLNRLPITITLINTLNATDYAEILCDNQNDGTENINLTAYNPNLISNTSGCTFEYYNSLLGATNQSSNDHITNANGYSLGLGLKVIYVSITSSNGCHQIVELQLTLVSKPVIPISDIMPICEGGSITVDAGTGYDGYLWSTGATTSSIVISNPNTYSVTVTENHGTISCSSTKNFSVVQSNIATISEVITSDWTNNENTVTVLLTGNSVGHYEYSLDGIHYQDSNTFSGLESGEYTVFVRDKNGCGVRPEGFYLLMYPKFFTPNGDGFNDTWKIKFSRNEPNLMVKLFDRFGKLLKVIDNKTGWNGTLNNQELPSTDYWFVVTRANGKEYKGHFALKR